MKRIIAFILCCLMMAGCFAGCKSSKPRSTYADLSFFSVPKQYSVSFKDGEDRNVLRLESDAAELYAGFVSEITPVYPYSELYGVEECFDRIFTEPIVEKHEFSALDESGRLTAEHLREVVKVNNQSFYGQTSTAATFYKEPDDEFMLSLCGLIVDVCDEMRNRYPDIDYDRVYCNFGRLKIFYKAGLLSYAQVTTDMIMQLSDGTLQIADIMNGSYAIRDVIIHEIMHVIQYGCACEKTEHCERHVGFIYRWDDTELQGHDWSWLAEGSAELNMCMLTGDDPITYKSKINYIQSINLATFLKDEVHADYAQTLSFYSDPGKLFDLFGAQSREEITEIAYLMEAIQIMQESPDEFMEAYADKYGVDISEGEKVDRLRYELKPAICVSFAKSFYKELAYALSVYENVALEDVFYLIRIFEAAMEYHLVYSDSEKDNINQPFLDSYRQLRSAFFEMLQGSGFDIDESDYFAYEMFTDKDEASANASFSWLDSGKKTFLIERTDFLKDRLKTGVS